MRRSKESQSGLDWSKGLIILIATTVSLGAAARLAPSQWTTAEMGNPVLFSDLNHIYTQSTSAYIRIKFDLQHYADRVALLTESVEKLKNKIRHQKCEHSHCLALEPFERYQAKANILMGEIEYLCQGMDCRVRKPDNAWRPSKHKKAPEYGFESSSLRTPTVDLGSTGLKIPTSIFGGNNSLFGGPRVRPRPTRQLGGLFGLIGIGLGVYNTFHMNQLEADLSREEERLNHFQRTMAEQDLAIRNLVTTTEELVYQFNKVRLWGYSEEVSMYVLSLLVDAIDQLDTLSDFLASLWTSLTQRRLSPRLFHPDGLQEVYASIQEQAREKSLKLMGLSLANMLDTPVTWRAHQRIITVLYHIPVVEQKPWQLYRWIQAPIHYSNGSRFLIDTRSKYLAVSERSRAFREFTTEEYQSCRPIDDAVICPAGVMTEKVKGSCLASLYMSADELIHVCPLKLDPSLTETMIQVNWNTTIIIPARDTFGTTVTITCPIDHGHGPPDEVVLAGVNSLSMDLGCIAATPFHSLQIRQRWWFGGNLTTTELKESHLQELVQRLYLWSKPDNSTFGHMLRMLNKTLDLLPDQTDPMERTRENFGVVGTILLAIGLVITVGFGCYYYRKRVVNDAKLQEETLDRAAYLFQMHPHLEEPEQRREAEMVAIPEVSAPQLEMLPTEEARI